MIYCTHTQPPDMHIIAMVQSIADRTRVRSLHGIKFTVVYRMSDLFHAKILHKIHYTKRYAISLAFYNTNENIRIKYI